MAEKLLGYELVVPDEFFKGEVFYDVLQQQMKVEGLTQPTQEMIEYAQLRARYATFQDESFPAKRLPGLERPCQQGWWRSENSWHKWNE